MTTFHFSEVSTVQGYALQCVCGILKCLFHLELGFEDIHSQNRQNVFGFQFPLKEDTSTNIFDNNLNKPFRFNNATN